MATQNRYVIADGLLANNAVEGTYNVYFTELEDADVDSFADLVADKIDYNSIKNAPNAAAGNYNDAIGENNYLHPFKKIAFSGEAQDLDGLANVAISGDYNDLINKPSIEDYNLSVSYDEIEGAPGITAGEYADEDGGESVLHDFDKIAFSGEYEDLKHAPALPENAYEKQQIGSTQVLTGNINPFNKAAFGDFSDLSESDYTSNYIIQLPFVETTLCESESGSFDFSDGSLQSVAGALYNGFAGGFEAFTTYGKTVYLITENSHMIYILLSTHYIADRVYDFVFTPIFNTNYNSLRELSNDNIVSQLDIINNNLAEKLVVVFDWAKVKMHWKLISSSDFVRSPAANITNQDITNWNNKPNTNEVLKNYSLNFSDFIYTIDQERIAEIDQTKLLYCGFANNWIENIDTFYNYNGIKLTDAIKNLSLYFTQGQLCYLLNMDKYCLITDIVNTYDENQENINTITIYTTPFYVNNFDVLNTNNNHTPQDINNILNNFIISVAVSNIVIDLKNNILYSVRKIIAPMIAANEGIFVNNGYQIGLQLSSNLNNELQLNNTEGEQGIYYSNN